MKNFLKTFKQELLVVPVGLLLYYVLSTLVAWLFPNTPVFDFFSWFDSILAGIANYFVVIALAWVGLRIVLPIVFKFMVREFYSGFGELPQNLKYILGVVIFLVFMLVASNSVKAQEDVRHVLLKNLTEQLDVREVTSNSSPMIDQYLAHVGFHQPAPWCAAFTGFNLSALGVDNPRSAWSPNYARERDVIWYSKSGYKDPNTKAKCGDVVTFYYPHLKRVGHVGFYIKTDKSGYFITIEGNTNANGSRTGDGVYMKKRHPKKTYAISRYIKDV